MHETHRARRGIAVATALAVLAINAGSAFGHEDREVGPYTIEIGLIGEPVYVGQKSGLEIGIFIDEEPVEGLEDTLQATVTKDGKERDLTLTPRFGEAGWYQSVFIPTSAGAYTFHITGEIEGTAIDETFTSNPGEGFGEVNEVSSAQFPVTLPGPAELADQAKRGADAAGLVPVALGLGVAGLVVGLAGLGLALGARRRAA